MSQSEIPQASYRYLGESGLRVSVPILGGMSIGNPKWNPMSQGEDTALLLLKAAWDCGVTTWDLANMYSNGESERLVGKFIKQYNIPRKNLVLIDKCRFLVNHEDPTHITSLWNYELKNHRDYVNQGGLSRTAILNQVQDSLERLGTDYLDVLMIHGPDISVKLEETMRVLNELIVSGKVRYIGTSNMKVWHIAELNAIAERHGWATISCVQIEYSLIYRAEEADMIDYCKYKGIGIIAYGVLAQGYLARPIGVETVRSKFYKDTRAEMKFRKSDLEIIERVATVAEKRGLKRSQVAILWALKTLVSPVVGVNNPDRLFEIASVAGKSITEEDIKFLEEPYEPQILKYFPPDNW